MSPDVLERISVVTEGEQKGNAVSYALAKEFVAHRAAKIDVSSLRAFLGEYTRHVSLSSDEIWLFFDMLKLALIENIAYLCKRIRFCIKEYDYAGKYAAYVLAKKGDPAQMEQKILRYFARGRVSRTFVSAFLERMKREGQTGTAVVQLVNESLRRRGMDGRQIILDEQAAQAQYQTGMGGCIRTIVALGDTATLPRFMTR